MRYRLRDVPAMMQTPIGRKLIGYGLLYRTWPMMSRLARIYRRTVVRKTHVIAVVGSFGKSNTTRAASAALRVPPHPRMLFNAWSSVAFSILRIRPSQRHAVIEVGIAAPGQMEPYARVVRPNVTVVMSIGSEHNGSLPTLDVTRAEKSRMVRALSPSGTAVLNGDDPNVLWMKGETNARVITFGFGANCDVRAEEVRLDWPHGTRFRLLAFGEQREAAVRLIGRHMLYPVLAAIAVSQVEGCPLDETLALLASLAPAPGRMEPVALPNGVVVLRDDFKSTLETIHTALDVLAEIPARRRILLLGDVSEPPGPQRAIYREVGERVARIASHLIVVGHGLERYRPGAVDAGMPKSAIYDGGRTPQQAAEVLKKILQPGDVLLIKGRDTQMLDRVRLILQGQRVLCDLRLCRIYPTSCPTCPMLEKGWSGHRVIM